MYATAHDTVLVVVQVVIVLFVAWVFFAAHQARMKRKHEINRQILDKMDSEKFLELLQSEAGRRSVERLLGTERSAREWVTEALRRGTILLCAGPAFLVVYFVTDFSGHEMFLVLGVLSVAVGLGFLLAAAITRAREGEQ